MKWIMILITMLALTSCASHKKGEGCTDKKKCSKEQCDLKKKHDCKKENCKKGQCKLKKQKKEQCKLHKKKKKTEHANH